MDRQLTVAARHGIRQISPRHIHRKSLRLLERDGTGIALWMANNGCVHGISGMEKGRVFELWYLRSRFIACCTIVDSNMKTFMLDFLTSVLP